MPSQPKIAICHGLFVHERLRGQGNGHLLKATQETQLKRDLYDYAVCTCDGANTKQQAVLEQAGWRNIDSFHNTKTGAETQVWGRRVSEISP
jgi:GNAT superfamily N-acetyltransferase